MPALATRQATVAKSGLDVALHTKVLKKLREYQVTKAKVDALDAQLKQIKADVESAIIEGGAFDLVREGIQVEEFPLKYVQGTRSDLDRDYMVAKGWVTLAQFDEATRYTTTDGYLKVTMPKDKAKSKSA